MARKQKWSESSQMTSLIKGGNTFDGSLVVAAHSVQRRRKLVLSTVEPRPQQPRRVEPGLKDVIRFCLNRSPSSSPTSGSSKMRLKSLSEGSCWIWRGRWSGWASDAVAGCTGSSSATARSWNLQESVLLMAMYRGLKPPPVIRSLLINWVSLRRTHSWWLRSNLPRYLGTESTMRVQSFSWILGLDVMTGLRDVLVRRWRKIRVLPLEVGSVAKTTIMSKTSDIICLEMR